MRQEILKVRDFPSVVDGVSLYGGRGTAFGTLGGLFLIVVIQNAMNMAQIEA